MKNAVQTKFYRWAVQINAGGLCKLKILGLPVGCAN